MEFSHESIFHSSIRSFSHMFFGLMGFFIALIPIILVLALMSSETEKTDKTSLTYLQDHEGNNTVLPSSTPAILRINIHGIIGMEDQTEDVLRTILNDSRKGLLKNNRVKGILLHVNSSGGGVTASNDMYTLIKEYKEKFHIPIYAYADGICASGSYEIACAADQILASPCSIIGSVGVISGPYFNVTKTLEKIGMDSLTLTKGKDKDALSPFHPWKEGEDSSLKEIIDQVYQILVTTVSNERPLLTKDKLINEYGALIFASATAKENGYIDNGDMTYTQALKTLLKAAKIDENSPYQLVELKPKKNRLKELFNGENSLFKGKMDHVIHLGAKEQTLNEPFLYLYRP